MRVSLGLTNRWVCANWHELLRMLTQERLEFIGVTLGLAAAGLHLVWGVPRLLVYLRLGQLSDLRPLLFVLSGLIIIGLAGLIFRGHAHRWAYALLIGLLGLYLAGYVVWHLGGHPILLDGSIQTHGHPDAPLVIIMSHLLNDTFALVTALLEVGAIIALALLLRDNNRVGGGSG